MSHFNNEQKNEILVIPQSIVEENAYEKIAEMVLSQSLFSLRKIKLMEQIDYALINRDEELFMELSEQYKLLLSQQNQV